MVLRLVTLVIAQAFDLATFHVMVARFGLSAEANPIVQHLFESNGMPALFAAKIALVLLTGSLTVLSAVRGGHSIWAIVGGLPLALAIAAGLIGGITNAAVVLG